MLKYKVDILEALNAAGYSSYRLSKEKILGNGTIQKLRERKPLSWESINTICSLLKCQPSDIIEYVDE